MSNKSGFFFVIYILLSTQYVYPQGAGNGVSFDGTDDYVTMGDVLDFERTDLLTFEAWINMGSISGVIISIIGKRGADPYPGYAFDYHTTNNVLEFKLTNTWSTNSIYVQSPTVSVEDTSWHHVSVTYDGSSSASGVTFYLDGVTLSGNTNNQDNLSATTITSESLIIGAENNGSVNFFKGNMDEVRIWNVTIPADTIRKYMCRKVTSSHGYWSNLKGYWRFDEGSGQTAYDQTANDNDGTLGSTTGSDTNDPTWVTSGAAIGDASANDYAGTNPGDFSANLAHTDGDDITATGDGGTVTGIQVYRVDEAPNVTTPPSGYDKIDPLRYWGVFIVGSSPTYTITYNYDGHPGITTESTLKLAYRADNSTTSWTDLVVVLDEGANTLSKTAQSGIEYILGTTSSDNSLPVELTSFTARQEGSAVVLEWMTESEIANLGFIIERKHTPPYGHPSQEGNEMKEWQEIASYITHRELQGQGSVAYRTEYSYTDNTVEIGKTYDYRLADVSYKGVKEYHTLSIFGFKVAILISGEYSVSPAYPNPFNPETTISFSLPEAMQITIAIYDLNGREVAILTNREYSPGSHSVVWNAVDSGSGIYIYHLNADSFAAMGKLVLVK